MILAKKEILERIQSGSLSFDPELDKFQLQQHSVDMRLGFKFLIPKAWDINELGRVAININHLDADISSNPVDVIQITEGQFFEILPGEHVTVSTLERVELPNDLMAILYPRSSVNRRGLSVDLTGIVDAGFSGYLLIPVRNNTQSQIIRLYPGERFCQIVFEKISGRVNLRKSRWHNKDISITIRKEEHEVEMEYVRTGRIGNLKSKFRL